MFYHCHTYESEVCLAIKPGSTHFSVNVGTLFSSFSWYDSLGFSLYAEFVFSQLFYDYEHRYTAVALIVYIPHAKLGFTFTVGLFLLYNLFNVCIRFRIFKIISLYYHWSDDI